MNKDENMIFITQKYIAKNLWLFQCYLSIVNWKSIFVGYIQKL